jgi:hypothetical protein
LNGVWWAIPISWGLGMIFSAVYFYGGGWQKRMVIKPLKVQGKDEILREREVLDLEKKEVRP